MAMSLRATATTRPPLPPPPSSPFPPPRTLSLSKNSSKSQFRPSSASLPISTTLSLFPLFSTPHEAKALSLSKDQIVSSLTQVEKTIDQVQEVGSSFFDVAQRVFRGVAETVKPGIDVALPILKQAGDEAVKIASPAVSEASKKAQEAIQSSGFDTQPVLSAAKSKWWAKYNCPVYLKLFKKNSQLINVLLLLQWSKPSRTQLLQSAKEASPAFLQSTLEAPHLVVPSPNHPSQRFSPILINQSPRLSLKLLQYQLRPRLNQSPNQNPNPNPKPSSLPAQPKSKSKSRSKLSKDEVLQLVCKIMDQGEAQSTNSENSEDSSDQS